VDGRTGFGARVWPSGRLANSPGFQLNQPHAPKIVARGAAFDLRLHGAASGATSSKIWTRELLPGPNSNIWGGEPGRPPYLLN